ncbi:MAG: hypothetical protein IMF04_00065, partial [Proteobacteria bacterium]|nr:hypothetical protein [Pseudomonadota bacterium]
MVTFSRSLLIALLFSTWASIAQEGTVLIDTSKGIDNTVDPAVTEIKDLSESLNEVEETTPEPDDVDIPDTTSEPTILIDTRKGIDQTKDDISIEETESASEPDTSPETTSEPIILIDKTKGIDETLSPDATEINEISESLKNIDSKEPIDDVGISKPDEIKPAVALPAATPKKPSAKTPAVTTAPGKKVEPKQAAKLPKIVPKSVETKDQFTIDPDKWLPRDNDLRLLEIRVAQYKLEDVIPAYQYEDVVLIPIGILSELLDIAIKVKPGSAQGFIFKEEWTFMLDTTRAEVILQGKPESYDRSLVHELDDDIYVESNLLSKWMLMTLDIDLFSSRMWITSKEKLPFLKRLEREQR